MHYWLIFAELRIFFIITQLLSWIAVTYEIQLLNVEDCMELCSLNNLPVSKKCSDIVHNLSVTQFYWSAWTVQQVEHVQNILGYKLLDLVTFKWTFEECVSLISWPADNKFNHNKLSVTGRVGQTIQRLKELDWISQNIHWLLMHN